MKKTLILFLSTSILLSCTKNVDFPNPNEEIIPELQIKNPMGIKLETAFVTTEVSMNIKMEKSQIVSIKIFDISNRVVSKETMNVNSGDNILKVYTSALPSSAYRIGIFDSNNNQLGITDFNKL
jgi:hypothetical protein